MADQDETTTTADAEEIDEESEVEGFGVINTTRSNIKGSAGVSTKSGIGDIGMAAPGIAIKEQGIK